MADFSYDKAGNVTGYVNRAGSYETEQGYAYDGLYQLTEARGESVTREAGMTVYRTAYEQRYAFDDIGNMVRKESGSRASTGNRVGTDLNYRFDYEYYEGYGHRAERIGNRYYRYDGNGNVVTEREGGHGETGTFTGELTREGPVYGTDYGFALEKEEEGEGEERYERRYTWDERNRMTGSRDAANLVQYRYGEDGERAVKYAGKTGKETLYFSRLWQVTQVNREWRVSKHIYVGNSRVVTKNGKEGNENTEDERNGVYYYHGDHLGSAQVVTDREGKIYERYEYTPYGEVWIEWENREVERNGTLPYRFTGKELDEETGLYYYGARYLDPRAGRWLSADPAMGEYLPEAPVNDEARRRNGNLPGTGGIYNYVNMHVYHYAGNNPVKYMDPDGRIPALAIAVIKKVAIDGVKGAAISVASQYVANTTVRFISGEGMYAFVPRKSEIGGYGKATLKGFGEGVISGGTGSIGAAKNVASIGRIGNGIAAAGTTMLGSGITKMTENITSGVDITEGLGESLAIAAGVGFASGFFANTGIETKKVDGLISSKGAISIDGGTRFAETATEAFSRDIILSTAVETTKRFVTEYE